MIIIKPFNVVGLLFNDMDVVESSHKKYFNTNNIYLP